MLSVLWCKNVIAYSSDDDGVGDGIECLQEYLKQKEDSKIESTSTVTKTSSRCGLITSSSLKLMGLTIGSQITSTMPDDALCLIDELRTREITDIFLKLLVIQKSELSESEMKTRMNKTGTVLENELVQAALNCDTDQKKIVEIFHKYLRNKISRNLTYSAFVHNYCFAKYAVDVGLFPLENIEINSYGIANNVNCGTIIREEREREEQRLRTKYMRKTQTDLECIVEEYKIRHIFDVHISLLVLRYLDFPRDIEEKLITKFRAHCWTSMRCGKYVVVNFCE